MLAALLHLSDSALPVGAYAHSFGLEGLCQDGAVHDEASFANFLNRDVSHALINVDLPLTVRAYSSALDADAKAVRQWDEIARTLRPTKQLRDAASKIGQGQWRIFSENWASESTVTEASWFHTFQLPVVSGVIQAELEIPLESCLWSTVYTTYSGLTQAALKLLPIGPTAAQRLLTNALKEIAPKLEKSQSLTDSELGTFNPLWDIAASRHEHAPARLFLS